MHSIQPAIGFHRVRDHIEVISVVGRLLEHSRVYYFRNGGDEQVYIGSADLMPRISTTGWKRYPRWKARN